MRKSVMIAYVFLAIIGVGILSFLRSGGAGGGPRDDVESVPPVDLPQRDGMVQIPGREFVMGANQGLNSEEAPAHRVRVDSFWIDVHEVTNAEFAQFVEETGYTTTAEARGWSYVFDETQKAWVKRNGANWRRPRGGESTVIGKESHPVVHVSHYDAVAYCRWAGKRGPGRREPAKRLPTEAEWECAARAGLIEKPFPWGDEERPEGRCLANYWQGWFPDENRGEDGHLRSAPVKSFPANRFGLHDMLGNVWEWCADRFDPAYYEKSPHDNPAGPDEGEEFVQRGGSFLSASNATPGFSVSMRGKAKAGLSFEDVGFRCVRDDAPEDGMP